MGYSQTFSDPKIRATLCRVADDTEIDEAIGSNSTLQPVLASNAHQLAATKLAATSQRYTSNRRTVVDALLACHGPTTIAEILAADNELAQSSTYRNLVVLEEAGVVHRIVTSDDHARFELTEAITGHHHHHLICEHCGRITDVTLDPAVESALETALRQAAKTHGFVGQHHRVDLVGTCRLCPDDPGASQQRPLM